MQLNHKRDCQNSSKLNPRFKSFNPTIMISRNNSNLKPNRALKKGKKNYSKLQQSHFLGKQKDSFQIYFNKSSLMKIFEMLRFGTEIYLTVISNTISDHN